jgi:nucleotide-binding universal stress UspA family protein
VSGFGTLLVATDFSPHSEQALATAIDLAKRLGARIHLVHAFDLPLPLLSPYEVAVPDAYLTETRSAAARRLEAAEARVRAEGVEVEAQLSEVPTAQAICDAARAAGADLIVMGTRGNSGLKHIVLGSVAEHTIRLAHCPVLAVKAEDQA